MDESLEMVSDVEVLPPEDGEAALLFDSIFMDRMRKAGMKWDGLGLVLPEDLSQKDWEKFGLGLVAVSASFAWVIGDWVNAGDQKYGQTYTQMAALSGWDEDTCKQYAFTAANVLRDDRNPHVFHAHHRLVASLPAKDQRKLLAKFVTEGEKMGRPCLPKRQAAELVRQETHRKAEKAAGREVSEDAEQVQTFRPFGLHFRGRLPGETKVKYEEELDAEFTKRKKEYPGLITPKQYEDLLEKKAEAKRVAEADAEIARKARLTEARKSLGAELKRVRAECPDKLMPAIQSYLAGNLLEVPEDFTPAQVDGKDIGASTRHCKQLTKLLKAVKPDPAPEPAPRPRKGKKPSLAEMEEAARTGNVALFDKKKQGKKRMSKKEAQAATDAEMKA
jgi:hypothetical protein